MNVSPRSQVREDLVQLQCMTREDPKKILRIIDATKKNHPGRSSSQSSMINTRDVQLDVVRTQAGLHVEM